MEKILTRRVKSFAILYSVYIYISKLNNKFMQKLCGKTILSTSPGVRRIALNGKLNN